MNHGIHVAKYTIAGVIASASTSPNPSVVSVRMNGDFIPKRLRRTTSQPNPSRAAVMTAVMPDHFVAIAAPPAAPAANRYGRHSGAGSSRLTLGFVWGSPPSTVVVVPSPPAVATAAPLPPAIGGGALA